MSAGLPQFAHRSHEAAEKYIGEVLTRPDAPEKNYLVNIIVYDDGHFRAVFDPAYFVLQEGHDAPTKSQWNTLKKKMKRHHRRVFVFKEYGEIVCGERFWCYVDFGFFAD